MTLCAIVLSDAGGDRTFLAPAYLTVDYLDIDGASFALIRLPTARAPEFYATLPADGWDQVGAARGASVAALCAGLQLPSFPAEEVWDSLGLDRGKPTVTPG